MNDAPTTNVAAATDAEDAAFIAITLTGSDIDGSVESFSLSSLPADGTLYTDSDLTTLVTTGIDYAATAESRTLYFVPNADFNGSASFDYTAKDDAGDSDTTPATATITVTPVNDEDSALIITAGTGVLANDTDADLDGLSVTAFDAVSTNGITVVMNPDGSFTYIPAVDFSGTDSLTYTVSAGTGSSATAVARAGNVVFTPDPGLPVVGSSSHTISDDVLTSTPTLVTIAADSGTVALSESEPELLSVFVDGASLILSTAGSATLGGLNFGDDDLVEYDTAANSSTLSFDGGALFSNTDEDIHAVHVLTNGHVILSTRDDATLGGLTFGDDDLIEYDPVTDTATLLFDGGALFSSTSEDIDAVHALSNGHIILSTTGSATLGGLNFGDDDLVEYDPVTDTATLFFDGGALFSNAQEDIDAVHVLSNGHIILSTTKEATLGGVTFGDDDLVEYDPVTDTAALLFDGGALFSSSREDISAVSMAVVVANDPPTVSLSNAIASLPEDADTGSAITVADIVVSDDGTGTNDLTLSGADAALFEIVGMELRLKAGTALDFETNDTLDVTVEVDDTTVGATPDDTAPLVIAVQDANDAPVVDSGSVTVAEESQDTALGLTAPTDADGDGMTIAVVSLPDAAKGTVTLADGTAVTVGQELTAAELTGLQYDTLTDVNGAAGQFVYAVDDGTVVVNGAVAFTITPANDPPTVSLTNTVASLSEDADTGSAITVADIVVSDDGTGTNDLSLSGADAALFEIVGMELRLKAGTALDAASNPALDVTVEVDDTTVGGTPDDTAPLVISVLEANDAPVVDLNGAAAGLDFATAFGDGGGPVAIAAGTATISDVDSATLASLTVSITNVQDGGLEVLTAVASGSVVVADNGTDSLTLSGGASLGEYETVLRSITYDNTAVSPTAGVRTIEVQADDGAAANNLSPIATSSMTVSLANDPPTISSLSGDTLSYIVPGGTAGIEQGDDALVQDTDSANFDGGQLTVAITTGGDPSEDVLSIENQGSSTGQIGFDGVNVTYGGTPIGTAAGGSGGSSLVVTLNAAANAAAATALVRSVTYENTDTTSPSIGSRGVNFTLTDGDGGTSATFSTTVAVSALASQTLEVRAIGTNNDAEESASGEMYLTSSDLEFVFDDFIGGLQTVGIRFTSIEIPEDAIITNAYIQFQADETDSGPTSIIIQGEATLDAQQFTSANGNISSRSTTLSSAAWLPAEWTTVGEMGADQQTPDITAIVQEIVDQAGWASGNSLVILFTGTGERTAESYDGDASAAPLLHIEYSFVDDGSPIIDLDNDDSSSASGNDYLVTYLVGGVPAPIADVDVMISDSNDTQLASARITLTNPELGDQLSTGTLPSGISLDSGSTATDLILTGDALLTDYAAAIGSITFDNTAINGATGDRAIEVVVNDGTNDSATATSTVSVTSTPDISFWVIADTPYSSGQEAALIQYLDAAPQEVEFVIHLGDIKSGSGAFTLDVYQDVADVLLGSSDPVFIIPGDNEYNDTSDPATAWSNWETTFSFFDQNWSHSFPVTYQAGREENFAFVSDGVLFIGINLVGGSVHDAQEFADRSADDLAWIEANIAQFGNQVGSAVIFGHASPTKSVYQTFEDGFVLAAQDFDKPILYLMGDKHNWQLDQPWSDAPNVTRIIIEQTGSSGGDSDPLLVSVSSDPNDPFSYDHDFGLIA